MGKYFRIFVAILAILSIAVLARNKAAWASTSSSTANQTSPGQTGLAAFLAKVADCPKGLDNDFGKRSIDKCNDKDNKNDHEDDNGQKDDEDDDDGTVKPPSAQLLIPVTGQYSVGGFCTLSIQLNNSDMRLDASLMTPLPAALPNDLRSVEQGCLLTYYQSDQRIDELSPASGNTKVCFAAIPGEQMVIYFYNFYAFVPGTEWTPLETTLEEGIACAAGNASGVYVATFQK